MKTTKKTMPISKALTEVWEWKEEVYNDINEMSFEEKKRYFEKGLNKAVSTIKGKLKANPDGSYSIVKAS